MWQPAAEDSSVLGLSHPGHKRTWRTSEAALLHLLLTMDSLGVFLTKGGRVWELGQNIQDGKLLSFLGAILNLRDGEALKRRKFTRDVVTGWNSSCYLLKPMTSENGVGRCPALMGEIRQLCLEMSGQRLNVTCWKEKLL